MNVQLTKRWVDVLRSEPEHGMGYQIVDFTLDNGACVRGVVVLNAELAKWPDDAVTFDPDRIQTIKASQG